ncbi:translation initiation factor IF-2 [Parasteatoda tepidariorum]|uniref:translation initiation factor IF-2 n=1 Tax=Parasteatoda tepidariorum TaxID=114398 RepID=UPI00077FC6BF|nr:probable serine/threonine-protein kinase clkA [Parasteatoda tepidariorum]
MNSLTLILWLSTFCTTILSYPYEDTYRQGDIVGYPVGNQVNINRNVPSNRNTGGYYGGGNPNSRYNGGHYGRDINGMNRGDYYPRNMNQRLARPGIYGQRNIGLMGHNQMQGQRRRQNGYLKPRLGLGGYRNNNDGYDYYGQGQYRKLNNRNRRPNLFYNDYNNDDYTDYDRA